MAGRAKPYVDPKVDGAVTRAKPDTETYSKIPTWHFNFGIPR